MKTHVLRPLIDPGLAVVLVILGATGILVGSVPELRWFLALTLGCGVILATGMFLWRSRRSATTPSPTERLEPVQINISKVPIAGGIGGLLVAVGSVVVLLVGVDQARWFFTASLACGVVLAVLLILGRKDHPERQSPDNTLKRD